MYRSLPVPVGSGYRPGYLARPDKAGRFPAVVLVPDYDGVSAHEKALARKLARHGLAVVAVDLYAVSRTGDALEDYHSLDDNEAIRVLDETHEWLASDDTDWAHSERIGILGLEIGGRFAIIEAAYRSWVASTAVVYAPLTGDEERRYQVADMLGHIGQPLLGLYAAGDEFIATDSVDEAQNRNASGSWLLYEGVGHGFLDESDQNYDQSSAEDAAVRIVEFFRATLPEPERLDLG